MAKYLIFLLLFSASVMFSCKSGGGPEPVAKEFIKCMNNKDFEGAKELSTEETKELLNLIGIMAEEIDYEMAFSEIEINEKDPDRAVCYIKYNGQDDQFSMQKYDGQWKVHMEMNK